MNGGILVIGADSVEIALTLSASGSAGRAGGGFGYRIFTGAAHHRTIEIPFPGPVGRRVCLEVSLEEEGWLGRTPRVRQQHLVRRSRRTAAEPRDAARERAAHHFAAAAGGLSSQDEAECPLS